MPRTTRLAVVGGASRRFGAPKENIIVGAERLVERTSRVVTEALGHAPMLVGGDDIPDDRPKIGPIGGLETALRRAKAREYSSVLVVACDMPGITVNLLRWIARHPSASYAVVPKVAGRVQPLFARYLTSFLPLVEEAISCDVRSLSDLLSRHPPYLIEEGE